MRTYILNFLTGSAGALIASAAARALPEPSNGSSRIYLWFYRFAHFVLANFDKSQDFWIPTPSAAHPASSSDSHANEPGRN